MSQKVVNYAVNVWREGVGVEPTQDLSQPHTGFEVQKAHTK